MNYRTSYIPAKTYSKYVSPKGEENWNTKKNNNVNVPYSAYKRRNLRILQQIIEKLIYYGFDTAEQSLQQVKINTKQVAEQINSKCDRDNKYTILEYLIEKFYDSPRCETKKSQDIMKHIFNIFINQDYFDQYQHKIVISAFNGTNQSLFTYLLKKNLFLNQFKFSDFKSFKNSEDSKTSVRRQAIILMCEKTDNRFVENALSDGILFECKNQNITKAFCNKIKPLLKQVEV